ncbi:unnamed protein product, partial [Timema podura]|nr:unnamed protein product [Timema podura]
MVVAAAIHLRYFLNSHDLVTYSFSLKLAMQLQRCIAVMHDSTLVGDFKDTINYEAQRFQASDVEMKSTWDGFLPIKEQIKVI